MTKIIEFMPPESSLPPDMRGRKYICEKCGKEIKNHFDKVKNCAHVDLCCACCTHSNCPIYPPKK